MARCLIATGSNLGDRKKNIEFAIKKIKKNSQVEVKKMSLLVETEPVGGPDAQSDFLNGAIFLETSLEPEELLNLLLQTEIELGRIRRERWAARLIDLDLLLYEDRVLHTDRLTLPHPRFVFRRFALEPAVEVAPSLVHPLTGWTLQQHLSHLDRADDMIVVHSEQDGFAGRVCSELKIDEGIRLIPSSSTDVMTRAKLIVHLIEPGLAQDDVPPRVVIDEQLSPTMPTFELVTAEIEVAKKEIAAAALAMS